jgi:general secretion pathway protein K
MRFRAVRVDLRRGAKNAKRMKQVQCCNPFILCVFAPWRELKKTGRDGSAILLTIFLTMIIVTAGIGFNMLVKERLNTAMALRDKAEAMVVARSAFESLVLAMMAGERGNASITMQSSLGIGVLPLNSTPVNASVISPSTRKAEVSVVVQDTNGMISLGMLNPVALRNLIHILDPDKNASSIVDSYNDWVTKGVNVSPQGAGDEYYRKAGKSYRPRHDALPYLDEMLLIRGMDRDLLKKLKKTVTTLPQTGFNPNTAGREVLMAFIGASKEDAEEIISASGRIEGPGSMKKYSGNQFSHMDSIDFVPSGYYEVMVKCRINGAEYIINAGVGLKETQYFPYNIFYRREE